MKPASFAYGRPQSIEEAVGLLQAYGESARVLAGGQSLIPMLNFRLSTPGVLVDIADLGARDHIEFKDGWVEFGLGCTQRAAELSQLVSERAPLITAALPWVGHVQTRSRGTICGSIAHADPAAELPAVLLTLDGEVVVQGPNGTRDIAVVDLFTGPFTTSLKPGELITAARVPAHPASPVTIREVARRHGDFALVGVAGVEIDGRVRLAAFGGARSPVRLRVTEAAIASGVSLSEAIAADVLDPTSDIHADGAYRADVLPVLVRRALGDLMKSG